MTIDVERLEHDRAYWDEVAPEGATHFIDSQFNMWTETGEELVWERGYWEAQGRDSWTLARYKTSPAAWTIIARPDEGAFPQVGDQVQLKDAFCIDDDELLRGQPLTVLARFSDREGEAYVAFEYNGEWVARVDVAQADNLEPYEDANHQALAKYLQIRLLRNDCADLAAGIMAKFDVTPK